MPMNVLTALAAGRTSPDVPPFVRSWTRDYDYLSVQPRTCRKLNPLPDRLEELDRSARFALYKIRRAP